MENISFRSILYGIIVLAIIGTGIFLFVNSQRKPTNSQKISTITATPSPKFTTSPTEKTTINTPITTNQDQNVQGTNTIQDNQITVPLTVQNNSGENGSAMLTETDGMIRISITLNGAPADIPQPAHIHSGTCPNPGGILYDLTPLLNGQSETSLGITLSQLNSQLPLSINVHKSDTEQGVYVACGNIVFSK